MNKKSFLVKEIVAKAVKTVELEGLVNLPFPAKEIFELRYHVLPVRTLVGEQCIAYFGEIQVKAYCINGYDESMRLVEQNLHYKGFAFFDQHKLYDKPSVSVKTVVQDIFAEKGKETIKITGLLSTEIVLSQEKEMSMGELRFYQLEADDQERNLRHSTPSDKTDGKGKVVNESSKASREEDPEDVRGYPGEYGQVSTAEVVTEVENGGNHDLIITLE